MKYPFSQLIREIFFYLQEASALVYKYTPSAIDAANKENLLTEGDANLGSFIVAPHSRSLNYNSIVASRNITQIHNLQLRKEGI